ncbi:MAG: alpha-L-fucosidase [Clostridia bacterium]|nr:alpha-L-fucosidase [Clostridia bacterium]
MIDKDRLDTYVSIVPTINQKSIQRERFNVFFHYGLNTFTAKEWGDGKVSPQEFNPTQQNTDQWVSAVKEAGAYGVILTCKHHDGFCLWQTKTTDYSVASSPYKGGKGDVVREVSDSCRKYGLKFGIYLSPWDRNHTAYGTEQYNDVYCQQLEELLTGYGEVFCVWLDGACGSYMDGKPKQVYDWNRYFSTIRRLAPKACISNCGPDVRWVGNEGGFARESEWNVVPKFAFDIQSIESNSQQSDDDGFAKKEADIISPDLGSREFLSGFDSFIWYPAEVDVSIRPGWFYHKSQDKAVRSLKNLLKIYYNSVGGNSILLLNAPPDRRGLLHENDVNRLKQLGKHIRESQDQLLQVKNVSAPVAEEGCEIEKALDYSYDKSTFDPLGYYTPKEQADSYEITIELNSSVKINRVELVENVSFSQRIERFEIYANVKGEFKKVYDGTTVGYGRIATFKAVQTDKIKVALTSVRNKPYLEFIGVYSDNGVLIKETLRQRFVKWLHHINYIHYINRENKKSKKNV